MVMLLLLMIEIVIVLIKRFFTGVRHPGTVISVSIDHFPELPQQMDCHFDNAINTIFNFELVWNSTSRNLKESTYGMVQCKVIAHHVWFAGG